MKTNNKNLNFVFFGTPDIAKDTLNILKENGYLPSLIITSPDKPKGRKLVLTPPPVKIWAIENKIPYLQPEKLDQKEIWNVLRTLGRSDGDVQRKFSTENFRGEQNIPDFFLIIAYGKIIPESIINIPKFGSINIHYSLLPKYRGASPVQSAILNGDEKTGVSIQQMQFKLDSGPILAFSETKIDINETVQELQNRLMKIGAELLVKILPDIQKQKIKPIPQDKSKVTFCKKIKKGDGLINLESESPIILHNKYRAYAKWPRIYFIQNEKRVIITDAILENGEFKIKKVIPEGKKEIKWEEFQKQKNNS